MEIDQGRGHDLPGYKSKLMKSITAIQWFLSQCLQALYCIAAAILITAPLYALVITIFFFRGLCKHEASPDGLKGERGFSSPDGDVLLSSNNCYAQ